MRSDTYDIKKSASASKLRVCGIIALCGLLIFIMLSCRKRTSVHESPKPSEPSPPDLSHCTRVEIQLLPSTLDYFCPVSANHNLLSPEETKYLQSLEPIIVEDQQRIKALAHDVSLLSYRGPALGEIGIKNRTRFSFYHNSGRLTSFTRIGNVIQTEDRHRFRSRGFPSIATFVSQAHEQIQPFEFRAECAEHIDNLGDWLDVGDSSGEPYPQQSEWCDAIVKRIDRAYGSNKEEVQSLFACPGASGGKWHYAMNPNCKQDSPPDTVFLFEAKAGWNQHGGPELFTFDNHEPKGGCVLLNDGTVKFIRTQEELQQLRWK